MTTAAMRPDRRGRRVGRLSLSAAALLLVGCASPPSVAPLLEAAAGAMRAEADRLEAEVARDAEGIERTRRSLDAALRADVAQAEALDPQWVLDAAEGYAAAREALAGHAAALRQERLTRAENLRTAAEAQARAIELLRRQDALTDRLLGTDAWRLLRGDAIHPQIRSQP